VEHSLWLQSAAVNCASSAVPQYAHENSDSCDTSQGHLNIQLVIAGVCLVGLKLLKLKSLLPAAPGTLQTGCGHHNFGFHRGQVGLAEIPKVWCPDYVFKVPGEAGRSDTASAASDQPDSHL